MAFNWFKIASLAFFSCGLFSCVSTDIIEPNDVNTGKPDEIVLNLSRPKEAETRADNGFKLRYIAKIVRGSNATAWANSEILDRREIIEGENGNQIVFSVSPNDNYGIMVFADYIPVETQPDSKGYYKDYFYNTNTYGKSVVMRTTPGKDTDYVVSSDFFNNDNYDAFYGLKTVYKTEAEEIINMTLDRITAMVVFRDNSDLSGDCNVKVNKLGLREMLTLNNSQSSAPDPFNEAKNHNLTLRELANLDNANKDVFYFYTLADRISAPQHVSSEFLLNKEEASSEAFSIKEIPVKANYKTIVTGKFIPEDTGSTDPGPDDTTKAGDIILNVSANFSWEQQPLSK